MPIATNNPPRVLLTGVWLVPSSGGYVKTIDCFRQALNADVVSFTDEIELQQEGSGIAGAHHVPTGQGLPGRLFNWAPRSKLAEADILAANCDLISCHGFFRYHVLWMRKWVRRGGIPYWVVPHGSLDPYVFTYRALQKRLFLALVGRRHLREAAHVIFSTHRERDKAAAIYAGANTRVVPWPVAPIETADRDAVRNRMRTAMGILPEDLVLIYLGRLHDMKRPLETIEVVARAENKRLHLVVVGPEEGVTLDDCETKAASLGFKNLHMMGKQWGQQKDDLLLAADGYISLSIRENFGHSVAEAMSANLPVILSPGNDLIGELQEVRCGWFLHDDRLETGIRATREFADCHVGIRHEMGRLGREWVCRELSFDRFRTRLQDLALEAMAGRNRKL